MKKALFFSAIAALLFVASCEKKRCYNCNTTVTRSSPNTTPTVLSVNTKVHCDATIEEIEDVEETGTYQNRIDTFLTTTTTRCEYRK